MTGATASLRAAPPIGLLAELTHRCPLQCPYCSNPLELERANAELPAEVWLDALSLRGRADHRVLRPAGRADRQRDGAARAQLRPLDHRGRGDQPVREPPAGHPRPAAGLDRGPAGHSAMFNLIGRDAAAKRAARRRPACTCMITARRRGRAASSDIAPSSSRSAAGAGSAGTRACSPELAPGHCASRKLAALHVSRPVQAQGAAVPAEPGPAVPVPVASSTPAPRRTWNRPSGSRMASS